VNPEWISQGTLSAVAVAAVGKIAWDWVKAGRVNGHVKKEDFDDMCKENRQEHNDIKTTMNKVAVDVGELKGLLGRRVGD